MTSAPMSPRSMAQNGPARTRVRSRTRTPPSGLSAGGIWSSSKHALKDAAGDRGHAVTGAARPAPEHARSIERIEMREVVHVVHGLNRHPRADLEPPCFRSVAH